MWLGILLVSVILHHGNSKIHVNSVACQTEMNSHGEDLLCVLTRNSSKRLNFSFLSKLHFQTNAMVRKNSRSIHRVGRRHLISPQNFAYCLNLGKGQQDRMVTMLSEASY